MHYRPEIDGLRAVAVVPVILFHAGLGLFSGGFIGVDVFFVISGYLITTIILREMAEGRFSMWRFWERRARRILPALYVVMLACIPVAWVLMLPGQYLEFARSLLAVGLFASNILFWRESDYFAAAAEEKPLLHTWSLSVEEQFYILFPLLLALLWRLGRAKMRPERWPHLLFWVLGALALVSMTLSHYAAQAAPNANFYLLPTRAWELLAGALCAVWLAQGDRRGHDGLAGLGLTMILVSVFWFDATTPFPSLWALLPVGGTALIILYGRAQGRVGQVLSLRVMVGLGLISYSAYLWHQPLMAFARLAFMSAPPLWVMLACAAASLPLAALSWRFVEHPFRRPGSAFARPGVLAAGLIPALAVVLAVGLHGHLTEGATDRLTPAQVALMASRDADTSGCSNRFTPTEIAAGARCMIGDLSVAPDLAVIGDSHAAALSDALSEHLQRQGRSAIMLTGSWCAPLVNFATRVPRKSRDCLGRMTEGIIAIAQDPTIHKVMLVAQWSNYTLGARLGDAEPAAYTYTLQLPIRDWNTDISANPAIVAAALDDTLQRLSRQGRGILIVAPVPEYPASVPEALVRVQRFGGDSAVFLRQSLASHHRRHMRTLDVLSLAAAQAGADFWDPTTHFCPDGTCLALAPDGQPLYEDAHHLSFTGAQDLLRASMLQTFLHAPDHFIPEPRP